MKRNLTRMFAVLLTLGLLAGCGSKPNAVYNKETQTAPKPAEMEPVASLKIGQLPVIDGLAFWVAEQKNYYKEQGVDIELITFQSALERDAALEGGQIDGTMTDILGAVGLYANGTKVQIASLALGATKEESPFAIIAAPNSGINSAADLKNVEVAISLNSVIHYTTEKMLLENGLTADEIKLTNIPQIPVRFEALMSGQVKAATLPEPLLSLAVAKGAKVILSDADAKQNYSHSVIVFSDKAVKEKAEGLKRFFLAYNLAVLDIKADPTAYRELLAEKAKLPAEIKDSFKVTPFSPAQAPQKADVEAVIQWLLDKKIISKQVTYEEIVNLTLAPKAQ